MTPFARAASGALALLAAGALPGCVMPDQIAQIQKDVADVRQQMSSVLKEQADHEAQLAAMQTKLDNGGEVKRTEFADLKLDLEGVQRGLTAVEERANDLDRQMDGLSQEVTRSKEAARRAQESWVPPAGAGVPGESVPGTTPAPVPPVPPPQGAPAPDALYNQAYADFSKGNYALAISGFEEYAASFPESTQADNALYWIGECHFSEGRFDKAVESFDRMLEKYPDGDRAAAANLKKGLAYLEENDIRSAIVQLRYVTTKFPASDEAKIAREKLASLGAPAR